MMSLQELSANDTWIESAADAASAMMPWPLFIFMRIIQLFLQIQDDSPKDHVLAGPVPVIPADTGRYLTTDMFRNSHDAIPAAAEGY
jgi:hypothetical protein